VASLANLAKAPSIPRKVMIDLKVPNFTRITWDAPAGVKANGYYVMVRETYYPFWQKKIFTTDNSITLPYTKDNYYFAVQSVGGDGNESQIVIADAD
jgi:hypothetical protein